LIFLYTFPLFFFGHNRYIALTMYLDIVYI
jgi:hypothetical protein